MNLPGFFLGTLLAVAGIMGIALSLRLAGILKPTTEVGALGFDPPGSSTIPVEDDFGSLPAIENTFGRKLVSLGGIAILIATVSVAFALLLYGFGHLVIKMLEKFITSG